MRTFGSSRWRTLVLTVAAALGIGGSAVALNSVLRRPTTEGPMTWADEAYAPLRARLSAGERIGVIVASGDPDLDVALHYAAQYALAPAVVEPIYFGDCLGLGKGTRCRTGAVNQLAYSSTNPLAIASVADQLGLTAIGHVGSVVILKRKAQ